MRQGVVLAWQAMRKSPRILEVWLFIAVVNPSGSRRESEVRLFQQHANWGFLFYNLPKHHTGSGLQTLFISHNFAESYFVHCFLYCASVILPLKVVFACSSNYRIFNFFLLQFHCILFWNIFHMVLFFFLDWEMWPLNYIPRAANHLMN